MKRAGLSLGVLFIIVAFGGAMRWYLSQRLVSTNAPIAQNTGVTSPTTGIKSKPGWKTYVNSQHGYIISYPANAEVALEGDPFSAMDPKEDSTTTRQWYDSSCIEISDKANPSWSITIAADGAPLTPCDFPTGRSPETQRVMDTFEIAGTPVTAGGRSRFNGTDSTDVFFGFSLTPHILVLYFIDIDHDTNQDSRERKYQESLRTVHEILDTLRQIPGFVPLDNPPILHGLG